jgi:hypothetical protein
VRTECSAARFIAPPNDQESNDMSDYDSIEEIDINKDGAGLRIGIVAARFNAMCPTVCSLAAPPNWRSWVCARPIF